MFSKNADIPKKWNLFYEQAYEMLFHRHDASKPGGYQRVYKTLLAIDDFGRLFSALSFICLYTGIRPMSAEYLRTKIKEASKLVNIEVNAGDYLDDLEKRVCLVLQDGLEFSYTHKTFVEFFAGRFIASLADHTLIKNMISSLPSKTHLEGFFASFYHESPNVFIETYALPLINRFKTECLEKDNYNTLRSYKKMLRSMEVMILRGDKSGHDLLLMSASGPHPVGDVYRLLVLLGIVERKERDYDAISSFCKSVAKRCGSREETLTTSDILSVSTEDFEIIRNFHPFGRDWLLVVQKAEKYLESTIGEQRMSLKQLIEADQPDTRRSPTHSYILEP